MRIKAGRGIHIQRTGNSVQLYTDPIPVTPVNNPNYEASGSVTDLTGGDTLEPVTGAWEREPGRPGASGVTIKVIKRTKYDKDTDKNYNYYYLLTFSNTGQLLQVAGEYREVAFETTLHEHN